MVSLLRPETETEATPLRRWRLAIPLMLPLLACGPVYLATLHYSPAWAGTALDEIVPREEMDFARDAELPGPVFNDFLSGGHLIDGLEGQPVFIDSRLTPYDERVLRDYIGYMRQPSEQRFADLDDKYRFTCAFINHASAFAEAMPLIRSPDWQLIHVGKVASVFLRRELVDAQLAATVAAETDARRFADIGNWKLLNGLFYIYVCFDPAQARRIMDYYETNVPESFHFRRQQLADMGRALAGAEQALARRPSLTLERDRLQTVITRHYLGGRLNEARQAALDYLARFRDDGGITYNLACIEARLGKTEESWSSLRQALELGYGNFDLIKRDPDLVSLRREPEFAPLLASYEAPAKTTRTRPEAAALAN